MKLLLIATTALVCVTSLATAGTLPERTPGSGQSGLDGNGEFLCTYGFTIDVEGDDYLFGGWKRAATPIIGKGSPVNEIAVKDGPSGGYGHLGFRAAIYSSKSGKPGNELAGASAGQSKCGIVKVPISRITLEKGKKYWVVQAARIVSSGPSGSGSNTLLWVYDKKRSHGAMSQTESWTCSSSCSSHVGPWTPITTGVPYARVQFDKEAVKLDPPARSHDPGGGSLSPAIAPIRRGNHQGSVPRYPP